MLPYRPHLLLRNGHLQTALGSLVPGVRPPHRAVPIEISLLDGESLIAHEELTETLADDSPIVILIHGLGGCHRSPYMQRIAKRLSDNRLRCWRMDLRGSGSAIRYGSKPAHAGSSDDVAAVVAQACGQFPRAPIFLVGFSLGGAILLKMLGEAATGALSLAIDPARIRMALAVAPPIDLALCSNNMERLSRMVYTRYYLRMLSKQVALRADLWPQWREIPRRPFVKTIRQFDARYTAPLAGFESSEHYYAVCSSERWLASIANQTVILVDRDDPIVPAITFRTANLSPKVNIQYTRNGGHLGYIGRDDNGRSMRWMDYWVTQSITQALGVRYD